MQVLAGEIMDEIEDNFELESSPTKSGSRKKWKKQTKLTKDRRKKIGKEGKTLQVTRNLVTSIKPRYTRTSVIVGTVVPYAPTHQHGAKQGQYGKTKRGGPIPWGNVPARPFVTASQPTIDRSINIISKRITRGL